MSAASRCKAHHWRKVLEHEWLSATSQRPVRTSKPEVHATTEASGQFNCRKFSMKMLRMVIITSSRQEVSLLAATNNENTPKTRGQYAYHARYRCFEKTTGLVATPTLSTVIVSGFNMADSSSPMRNQSSR